MGENSAIEWCDHTFNPWIGCDKVSAGCTNCYAETLMDQRWGKVKWGQGQERKRTSPANWSAPNRWNKTAHAAGKRAKVFCASLADIFDEEAPNKWREDLAGVIAMTPHLDWLLLTKRPETIRRLWPGKTTNWDNVWWGVSAEDQSTFDERLPHLLSIDGKVHWISYEPALAPINFGLERGWCASCKQLTKGTITGHCMDVKSPCFKAETAVPLDWIIVGGESGGNARPFDVHWARSAIRQCEAAGVACFVKQLGHQPFDSEHSLSNLPDLHFVTTGTAEQGFKSWMWHKLVDRKGGDMSEWPEDLRVREFPR